MRSARAIALGLALATAQPVFAQGPIVETRSTVRKSAWTPVRLAKWALLGGAVGLGMYALHNSRIAEQSYDALRERCYTIEDACSVFVGKYQSAESEALYQRAVAADRRAQFGIFGGQVAVLGSVGLFIYDLRDDRTPTTIPYPGPQNTTNFVLATVVF